MKEIPLVYIKSNQTGIVIFTVSALLFRQPVLIFILLGIELAGLLFGLKWNVFVQLSKLFIKDKFNKSKTQAAELTKFNNTLAVVFLLISTVFFIIGNNFAGYVFAGILSIVVVIALAGFCLGCFLYFQFKRIF
jgi:fatty acid desaturase